MASNQDLRRSDDNRPGRPGRFGLPQLPSPIARVALLGVIAAAVFAGVQLASHHGKKAASGTAFLTKALGSPQSSAPLVRKPAPGTRVGLAKRGYTVRHRGTHVGLAVTATGQKRWRRYSAGVSRTTSFGAETITVGKKQTEQFLTVKRHRGKHRWEWRLDLGGLEPRLMADGSVRFLESQHRVSDLRLLPVAILSATGVVAAKGDVVSTPA
jgi:hypothetical protein